MSVMKILWQKSKLSAFLVVFQFLLAFFFAYASYIFRSSDLKLAIAVGTLAITFATLANNELMHVKDSQKIEDILTILNKIPKTDKEMSPLAEGLISIIKLVDQIAKRK